MKTWKPMALGLAAAAVATATLVPRAWTTRSVRLLPPAGPSTPARFDYAQSAALFVGVPHFTKEGTLDVPYAADDAVDLAYIFTLDRRVSLVSPERVVLALSGRPQKPASQRKLEELKAAGARVERAEQGDIVLLLQRQAAAAGKEGIFILSLATHGFVREGIPYILASDRELSTARIFDLAASSPARRSLLFIDACRERIAAGTRGLAPDPETAAPIMSRMGRIEGQVVFYAAAVGNYAYDDPKSRNGVFTKAVLDGLDCKAATIREMVTVDTLRKYVERETRQWIRAHRDPSLGAGIQVNIDGSTHNMPLSRCTIEPLFPSEPARVTVSGSTITAFNNRGGLLWIRDLGAPVLQAGILRKRLPEIIALTASRISILSGDGRPIVSYEEDALRHFAIDRPTARHAQKIIVSSARGVFLLDSKRITWRRLLQPATERIAHLEIIDYDNDSQRDIAVSTTSGQRLVLDFHGRLLMAAPARGRSTSPVALLPPR